MRVLVAVLIVIGLASVMGLAAVEATSATSSPPSDLSDRSSVEVDAAGWIDWFSAELRAVDVQRHALRTSLARLGPPVIGQTTPQLGFLSRLESQPPLTPPWIQVDLQEDVSIDRIALIPAVREWQADKRSYGFPPRFRIDISSNPDFTDPIPVADFTEQNLPDLGIAPLVVRVANLSARYVRVTVTKLAADNGQYFYAFGELMVLSGQRNVAIDRPVTTFPKAENNAPHWTMANLVDGRTALGPPIHLELLEWDGVYVSATPENSYSFMAIDLGEEFPLQEVRLYAIHARITKDIPGYNFPLRFRIEASKSEDFSDATTIFDTSDKDYPNPGDNAITCRASGVTARYVRIATPRIYRNRFGLSEMEVYANDRNVARKGTVTTSIDTSNITKNYPRSLLIDGFTSYGRLLGLPDWLDEWDQRTQWTTALMRLDERRPRLLVEAQRNAWWTGGAVLAATLVAMSALVVISRRRRVRELAQLRQRLARDLHDEIGSNLAAIARLSEFAAEQQPVAAAAAAASDWNEVNRIAHESVDGMREILWLAGAREEAGPDLANHLLRLVKRMLGGVEVRWTAPLEALPTNWHPAARRELFLMVKEALTNVMRHSQATLVELGFVVKDSEFQLEIRDHGRGFNPTAIHDGMGMTSLRERARTLGGKLIIESAPGTGTTIRFAVPVAKLQASTSGSVRTASVRP